MTIVYPSEAVARRWADGLRARLRRAPLDTFLRARGLTPAAAGVAQDSDDVARATALIVEIGVTSYCEDRVEGLDCPQRTAVAHVACLVSRTLAELISQPVAWRIAALVSTARLLTPWIGLNAAAMESAAAVRAFQRRGTMDPSDLRVMDETLAAVNPDDAQAMLTLAQSIADCLKHGRAAVPINAAEDRTGHG
jgi:hypothetical protein